MAATTDEFLNDIFTGYLKRFYKEQKPGIDEELWKHNYNKIASGVTEGFSAAFTDPDYLFLHELKQNAGVFSAFKVHDNSAALVDLLRENKQIRSFSDFKNAAFPIVGKYNVNWLQSEYSRALASGRMAAKWKQIERTKHLYPNLKYVAIDDDRTRPEHHAFDNLIYPVEHPFWDSHYPPNGWRCRCTVMQTDQPVNEGKYLPSVHKDFRNNVGKTGDIYPDHPYYTTGSNKQIVPEALQLINRTELPGIKKEALAWAKRMQSLRIHNKEVPGIINITQDGLNHSIQVARNMLPVLFLSQLPELIALAKFDSKTAGTKAGEMFYKLLIDREFAGKNYRMVITIKEYEDAGAKFKFYDLKIKGEPA